LLFYKDKIKEMEESRKLIKACKKNVKVCKSEEFWEIIDLLYEEYVHNKKGFYCNKNLILDAFKENRLFILECEETDDMFYNDEIGSKIRKFCLPGCGWSIPSFCILEKNSVDLLGDINSIDSNSVNAISLIWTFTPLRKLGLANTFIEHFNITEVDDILEESIPFWSKSNVKYFTILNKGENEFRDKCTNEIWSKDIERIKYILETNNTINKEIKPVRKPLPDTVRVQSWIKTFGRVYDAKCFCCDKPIDRDNFQAGHIVSVHNGGTNNINNLKPVCSKCNGSMGTKNMNEFKKEFFGKN